MSVRGKVAGAVAGALGVAAVGTAIGITRQQRRISSRAGEAIPFTGLRSEPIMVVAEDGVPLHVEIDEVEPHNPRPGGGLRRHLAKALDEPEITVVFVHGYCLNLDSWHFQRAAYRGLVRTVLYDQRSHGRSGHSSRAGSNIDQLGRDLKQVLDHAVPSGHVVLVGHSMGGMTIVALAEQYPELFGDKVAGVALISSTAGGLDPSKILLPMLPARLSGPVTRRAISTLHRGHRGVDAARRLGSMIATVATDWFAFGEEVPEGYVEFVDDMLSATPFEVVGDFFPSFGDLDKFHSVEALGEVPTSIVCGTSDRLTSIGHSRKLHARIPGSQLLECENAGHMVMMERHDQVTSELDQLISAATSRIASR